MVDSKSSERGRVTFFLLASINHCRSEQCCSVSFAQDYNVTKGLGILSMSELWGRYRFFRFGCSLNSVAVTDGSTPTEHSSSASTVLKGTGTLWHIVHIPGIKGSCDKQPPLLHFHIWEDFNLSTVLLLQLKAQKPSLEKVLAATIDRGEEYY